MKVIIAANSRKVKGGINSVIISLMEGLKQRNTDVTINRFSSYIDSVSPFLRIIYSILAILRFPFSSISYNIVHLHSAAKGSFYRKSIYTYLSKILNKKLVFHIHASGFEDFKQSNRFNSWLVRKTLNRADYIIVLSDQMKRLVETSCDNDRVSVLPNPIVIPEQAQIDAYKEAHDKVQLLFLGEIGPRKGIYDLVDAIELLPESSRNKVTLHVCGNNEIDKLKEYIASKQLTGNCIVHGWIDGEQKKKFLSNADVYILPSYAEGLPISILEAMAYGLPVISTNVGGIPEIVRKDENGFLIEPGDTRSLAEAVEMLVNDFHLRLRYGQKSKTIVQPHDLNVVLDQLVDIYRDV
ncbi:glycosyl transferase [Paenibacillus baekrokdamisoli]|uniref:Glycosyl transferase n=1 Tax=Paenibacillus baekrokdamisoli TaxID=1712516 RepID=A0A3G9JIW9_9BACL|nr:glycosyltransferase family 4 protein [Paenibacillus baekrokdamisoli]MBB3067973.1 glycosyltransferase involved in cell wall biosynthesis [Paenibacillus baekrokdamisoli]BBH22979.1 glycosyl transferase [Paenibacillus baekrokdamisoli]